MNNTPSHIASRLAELNRKVGTFVTVEWSPSGFDDTMGDNPSMVGPCYIIYKHTSGAQSAVRTMSEAFNAAWAIFKFYRNLERRGF